MWPQNRTPHTPTSTQGPDLTCVHWLSPADRPTQVTLARAFTLVLELQSLTLSAKLKTLIQVVVGKSPTVDYRDAIEECQRDGRRLFGEDRSAREGSKSVERHQGDAKLSERSNTSARRKPAV